jgi:CRISPR-associated protein Cmr2
MSQSTLVFSIGPVQGFIAQSRRTADGWVGSYLLSYLVCKAALVLERDGKVVEPYLQNIALYKALMNDSKNPVTKGDDLTIAGLPNNVLVQLNNGVDPFDAGNQASKVVKKAWEDLAAAILDALDDVKQNQTIKDAWARQTSSLWETYWAWGENSTKAFRALAARKGLRNFPVIEEQGDRCTLCAEREALWDGEQRCNEKTARDATVRFWREFADTQKPEGLIKSDGKERLCAPCLIKRLIPWVKNEKNEIRKLWGTSGDVVFPSTSTMATVLTKADLVRLAYREDGDVALREAMKEYVTLLRRDVGVDARPADPSDAFVAWKGALASLTGDAQKNAECFIRLDGDWLLFGEAVKNDLGIGSDVHRDKKDKIDKVDAAYHHLIAAMGKAGVQSLPIYWALLTMDGDRMGKLKENFPDDGLEISQQINEVAQGVRPIVKKWNGRLVYAGGDDVLALFPVETALEAAEELRQTFAKKFSTWFEKKQDRKSKLEKAGVEPPTLSGSIIYAHHQAPLGALIHRGHVLLSEWAKGRAGRNALAVEVRNRGGATLTFAARWKDEKNRDLKTRIDAVVNLLKAKGVASRFLYSLRENAELLGESGPIAAEEQREKYVASLAEKTRLADATDAVQVARVVLALCGKPHTERLSTEPLIFARFLYAGGREER